MTNDSFNRIPNRVAVLLLNARVEGEGGDATTGLTMQALYCAS